MITSLRHVGIVVEDLDYHLNFWSDVFGFQVYSDLFEQGRFLDNLLGLHDVKLRSIKMKNKEKDCIELLEFFSHKEGKSWQGKPYSIGITHMALNTNNISQTEELLVRHQVDLIHKTQTAEDGKAKVFYCKLPDGLLLEVVEEIL